MISTEPVGLSLDGFHAEVVEKAAEQITWTIRDNGFDMVLSGQVPATISHALRGRSERVLSGLPSDAVDLWAVHPGGKSVLDAVENAFDLDELRSMPRAPSYATTAICRRRAILSVLEAMMRRDLPSGARGCAMAFGPGLTAETMLFSAAA